MLDIRFIRENRDLVEKSAKAKGYTVNIENLLSLDDKARQKIAELQPLREKRNKLSEQSKGGKPTDEQIAEGKRIREEVVSGESELAQIVKTMEPLQRGVPNIIPDDTPLGGEEDNVQVKKWGEIGDKGFEPQDHLTWAEDRGLLDFERGAKVAGNKFYFLKGTLVELELAVTQLGMDLAKKTRLYADDSAAYG